MTNTILAVLAHPDDESFGMGGTLALYARRGADVYLVCATGGEVGTVDPEHLQGFSSIAELRASELRCAAGHLGLKEFFLLGYRDSGMPGSEENRHPDAQINHALDEVAGRVVKYIRELKTDVVLTFDPIGGYRHPDHIHIHQATVLAFERADDGSFHPEAGAPHKPKALYFQVFQRDFLKLAVRLMPLFGRDPRMFGRNKDIDLKSLAEVDFPTHVRIDTRSVLELKRAASACHASQGGTQIRRGPLAWISRLLGEREDFMRAYPPVEGRARVSKDLFDV
ncbi:MAG TPA: PIG-L deacetylase family protein [Anaerolineales bacterium]|jgi:LmbE family N-acetylglucosaminyl deacetylase